MQIVIIEKKKKRREGCNSRDGWKDSEKLINWGLQLSGEGWNF